MPRPLLGASLLTLALALPVPAALAQAAPPAASAAPATTAQIDNEDEIDQGLKRFGYLTGLALGCVTDAQRPLLQREALDLNAEINRLLGGDRAFLYAAAFGYGTSTSIKADECKQVLQRYEERVKQFRQRSGGSGS